MSVLLNQLLTGCGGGGTSAWVLSASDTYILALLTSDTVIGKVINTCTVSDDVTR